MKTFRARRWAMGLVGGLLLLVGTAGFVVFSVWIEDRFPSDDAQRAIMPSAQRMVTKPVVSALSRQIERRVRERAHMMFMETGLTLEETIARFLDERVDLVERRIFAYRLAAMGSPECVAALLKVFQTAPPEHRAFMAQLIGSTGNPAAREWLWPLLDDDNEQEVSAAIRGLSAIGGEDVSARVAGILTNGRVSDKIRGVAALGLGTIGTPAAREALVEAFGQTPSTALATQILNSMGQFDFPAIGDVFAEYLAAPETPSALRVVAVEALANSSVEAVPFLLEFAKDSDAHVRASAAWAISAYQTVNTFGPALAALVDLEPEVDVRRRLYEALLPQADIPAERLLPIVLAEQDIAARVAGFNAIGRGAHQQPTSPASVVFDEQIVRELVQVATAPNGLNIQMRAVFALRRAQTPAAQAALAVIANNAHPQVATAARNGLRATRS